MEHSTVYLIVFSKLIIGPFALVTYFGCFYLSVRVITITRDFRPFPPSLPPSPPHDSDLPLPLEHWEIHESFTGPPPNEP